MRADARRSKSTRVAREEAAFNFDYGCARGANFQVGLRRGVSSLPSTPVSHVANKCARDQTCSLFSFSQPNSVQFEKRAMYLNKCVISSERKEIAANCSRLGDAMPLSFSFVLCRILCTCSHQLFCCLDIVTI